MGLIKLAGARWDDHHWDSGEPRAPYVPENVRDGYEYVDFVLCRGCYGLMATHKARQGRYSRLCPDCVGNEVMR